MGFRKKNAKRSDNRSSAKVIMGKPASKLTKEETSVICKSGDTESYTIMYR